MYISSLQPWGTSSHFEMCGVCRTAGWTEAYRA